MSDFNYPYKKDTLAKTNFVLEPGIYPARCYAVVFMGSFEKVFKNNSRGLFCPISFSWEIGRKNADYKLQNTRTPWLIHQIFHYSTDPNSKLMALLQSWIGRYFTEEDIDNRKNHPFRYAGKYCKLQIGTQFAPTKDRDFKEKAFVQDVLTPDGTTGQLRYQMPVYWFSAATKKRDMQLFAKLPKWQQQKIRMSKEWYRQDADFQMEKFWSIMDGE